MIFGIIIGSVGFLSGLAIVGDPIIGESTTIPTKPTLYEIIPNPDGDGNIELKWSTSVGATSYNIYRSKDGGVYVQIRFRYGYTELTYTDTGLTDGSYTYNIRGVNNVGSSTPSNVRNVIVTLSIPVPPVPPVPVPPPPVPPPPVPPPSVPPPPAPTPPAHPCWC